MNTLDLYIEHLKEDLREAEAHGLDDNRIMNSTADLKRAVDFANERGLTVRHMTPENLRKREKRAMAVAEELWLAQNPDNHSWAKMAWAEMTMPDDWDTDALQLLEEAYTIIDKDTTSC